MTIIARRLTATFVSAAVLALPLTTATVVAADAAVKAKHYPSCAALNKVYPHGVGKKGAKDKHSRSSKAVTNFTVSSTVYAMNDGPRNKKTGEYDLDRDNDGIACERR